ncbi:UNVERIFIED_CONTAM: hypothetical protein RMT77_001870 [Armadillidium vulgare]
MKRIILIIYLLSFYIILSVAQKFVHDEKCLYEETGTSFTFDITPQIDFFIPYNWVNNEEVLNSLQIKLSPTNLVLRHPLSSNKGPGEISLPLQSMKVGWNRIYLKKDGNNLQVIERPPDNSVNVIQTLTFEPGQDPRHVSGLYSLANCFKDLNTRYYKIPAGKSVTIPYVMYKQVDRFDAFSDSNPFNFEVSFSGKRRQICKQEIANQPDVFSLPKDCKHWPQTSFSQNKIYNIFMYPEAFDAKDILKYNDFTFTEFVIHNTGTTDFYIQTFIKPETSAPISLLKVDGSVSPKEKPTVVRPIEHITDKVECGRNTKKSQLDKIIGGRPADPKDWPWMAALLKIEDSDLICGGVLITDRYVLTAAHCFKDFEIDQIKVRLGEYDFGTTTENNPSDFRIERRTDPRYDLDTRDNDLALLRLERPTSFGEFISPVCLPPRFETFETRRGIVVGWGTQKVGGSSSNILREIAIPILRRRDCESRFSPNSITVNMFCASLRGLDSCQGDSGGPFMIQQSDSRWYVVGIVSWGIGCGHISLPGVYTKVNNYLDWIQRHIEA